MVLILLTAVIDADGQDVKNGAGGGQNIVTAGPRGFAAKRDINVPVLVEPGNTGAENSVKDLDRVLRKERGKSLQERSTSDAVCNKNNQWPRNTNEPIKTGRGGGGNTVRSGTNSISAGRDINIGVGISTRSGGGGNMVRGQHNGLTSGRHINNRSISGDRCGIDPGEDEADD
jgi:hypothetical protein